MKKYRRIDSNDNNDINLNVDSSKDEQTEVNDSKTKKTAGVITFIIIILALVLFFVSIGNTSEDETPKNIRLIMNTCNTTYEQASDINTILEDCKIIEITSITHDELLDNWDNEGDKGYRITSEGINNIILTLDVNNKVYEISLYGIEIYSENTCKIKFDKFYLSSNNQAILMNNAQEKVKSILRSPSTAKFPWGGWDIERNPLTDIVTMSSYVDAQNAFGAIVRSYFTFQYKINSSSNTYSLLYFEFDGEVVVDYR